ncbi:hypothetical protein [Leeia aquatica]|uniref:Uncharacterized protein n=1 Tax=Leeia aquatica TaxID=2725557 RepID=A0A847S5B1_9NEIS|nr:hypothetical protein [Leeia aquatica]NLR73975.1 hypothetical protein [Leeia aquatica]
MPMRKHRAGLMMLFVVPMLHAAPLSPVLRALSVPADTTQTNVAWQDAEKLPQTVWKWSRQQISDHGYTLQGKIMLPLAKGSVPAWIELKGARLYVAVAELQLDARRAQGMAMLQGEPVQALRTSCDEDSATYQFRFFKVADKGRKPMYVSFEYSQGAAGEGSEVWRLGPDAESVLGERCKVQG